MKWNQVVEVEVMVLMYHPVSVALSLGLVPLPPSSCFYFDLLPLF